MRPIWSNTAPTSAAAWRSGCGCAFCWTGPLNNREQQHITSLRPPQQVRLASLEALQNCLGQPHSDLALIVFLRFWAEVLVAVEYECLWPRLSERFADSPAAAGVRSDFFYYHMIHDRRQSDIGNEQLLGGLTHSQELARHMTELIASEAALQIAISQVERSWALKDRFYRQFLPLLATR